MHYTESQSQEMGKQLGSGAVSVAVLLPALLSSWLTMICISLDSFSVKDTFHFCGFHRVLFLCCSYAHRLIYRSALDVGDSEPQGEENVNKYTDTRRYVGGGRRRRTHQTNRRGTLRRRWLLVRGKKLNGGLVGDYTTNKHTRTPRL